MRFRQWILLCGLMAGGCATQPVAPSPAALGGASDEKIATRNNAVSLLYDLFQDEKNVNKVLIIKRGSPELKQLITAIAHTSGDAAKRMEVLAQADPQLDLHAVELPAGEKATRASIARTKEHELLFSSGDQFAFQLLLTQTDALSYGWHLAKIAAEDSRAPEEVRAFTEIHVAYENLYEQTVTMLKIEGGKSPSKSP